MRSKLYAHAAFISCICLQRFGIHIGESALSLSLPVLFALIGLMLATDRAKISASLTTLFLAFAFWALLSTGWTAMWPDNRVGFSMTSLLNVLLVYAMLTVRPADDFDGGEVLRVFLFYARLCAVLGIIQYGLQFIGVRLFAFSDMIPSLRPFLLEGDFASDPLLQYGSDVRRSNGFLLVEPSTFSQLLAIAVVVDYFVLRCTKYLWLYLVAYMASYSGTGLISLVAALAFATFISGKNISHVLKLSAAAVLIVGLFAMVVPEQVDVFLSRFNEIGEEGSSGHARFLGQTSQLREFGGEARSLVGFGPGATMRSKFWTPGSGNPALQLFIDYGIVGVALFYVFLARAVWSRRYPVVSITLLVTFQFGGGNLLFSPFALLLVALGIWASATPSHAHSGPRTRAAAAVVN